MMCRLESDRRASSLKELHVRLLTHIAVVVATALVLIGCSPAPAPVDTSADEAALKAATNTWIDAYNAGDVEKIVALYTDDGVLMPPHASIAHGKAAIRAFLTADTSGAKAAGIKLVNGSSTVGVVGDTGWEAGSYTATDASGAIVDSGSYLSVSHKVNGQWLYFRDTYNSDRPLPAPTPAASAPAK
jgi:uncharacterized protein (TIGR02246 family)